MTPNAAKNIPQLLQSYVTYDTLGGGNFLLTAAGAVGPIWKVLR